MDKIEYHELKLLSDYYDDQDREEIETGELSYEDGKREAEMLWEGL